jgi:hypothetical protein
LMLLLSKSGESIGQEAESATFQQLQEGGSPIGELPQLSRIVNLLRGPVIYTAAEVRELQIECQRARGSLQDPQTKALLQDLDVASAKALEREGEIVIYRQTPLQVAGGPRYTIEVLGPQDSTNREIVAQFDNAEFSALWEELGVTEERWAQWRHELETGRDGLLLLDSPQLSVLASIDEGAIRYQGSAIRILKAECEKALSQLASSAAKRIVWELFRACDSAIRGQGDVVVHPFGAISQTAQ